MPLNIDAANKSLLNVHCARALKLPVRGCDAHVETRDDIYIFAQIKSHLVEYKLSVFFTKYVLARSV